MKISGSSSVAAPVDEVYAALNDPAVLVRAIPGCERLEALSPTRFAMTISAGVASIRGTYAGEVELADPAPPSAFTLRASGSGAPGSVSATVHISLTPSDSGTTVSYEADAVVGGAVGGVGQRVLSSVAKRTASDFFTALESQITTLVDDEELAAPVSEAAGVPAEAVGAGVFVRPAQPVTAAAADPGLAALIGGGIALAGVLLGWLIGRRR